MAGKTTVAGVVALLGVTLVWAFSFGLIGLFLSGVNPVFVATARLGLATLCFLPFLRLRQIGGKDRMSLLGIGAVQFGLMYIAYLSAFRHLESWQVALFTVFTPLWIALIDAAARRRWRNRIFVAATLSFAGAALIRAKGLPEGDFWLGFLLVQIANLAFGGGQVWFREWKRRNPATPEREIFGLLYIGALLVTVVAGIFFEGPDPIVPNLTSSQILVLAYLGLVASGLGFFFWNYGASRVPAGFLAASNNLVIPIGVLVAVLLTGTPPDWPTLAAGAILIAAGIAAGSKR